MNNTSFKKLHGGASPFMLGLVLAVGVVSMATYKDALRRNQEYQRDYVESKKEYVQSLQDSVAAAIHAQSDHTSVAMDSSLLQRADMTNIFDANSVTASMNAVSSTSGEKVGVISMDSNAYNKNLADSATSANYKSRDIASTAGAVISEETIRRDQILESYKRMQDQAERMYRDMELTSPKIWPCTYSSYVKDAWDRDFTYTRVSESKAQLSFDLPWKTSEKKVLDLTLPTIDLADDEVVDIQGGFSSVYVLTAHGNVWARGNNSSGQLGLGNTNAVTTWTKSDISNVKKLVTGNAFAFAITNSNDLYMTGASGTAGAGGLGSSGASTDTWTLLRSNISDVVTDSYSSFAIDSTNGQLYVTGRNTSGRLGLGDTTDRYTFVAVSGVTNVKKAISVSNNSAYTNEAALLLLNNGEVLGAGSNEIVSPRLWGILGIGSVTANQTTFANLKESPTKNLSGVTDIVLNAYDRSVVMFEKDRKEWWFAGDNICGTIEGEPTSVSYYKQAPDYLDNFVRFKANHVGGTYLIDTQGDLYVQGCNGSSLLGIDNTTIATHTDTGLKNITQVFFGLYNQNAYATASDGKIYGTGVNDYGTLGTGNSNRYKTWFDISARNSNMTGIEKVTFAANAAFALKDDGSVWGAGRNGSYIINDTDLDTQYRDWREMLVSADIQEDYTCP